MRETAPLHHSDHSVKRSITQHTFSLELEITSGVTIMHAPLFKDHPQCEEIVALLVKCHDDHKMGKFFGKCNDIKAELDICFMKEKIVKRDANLKKAREFDAKFAAYQARVDSAKEGK